MRTRRGNEQSERWKNRNEDTEEEDVRGVGREREEVSIAVLFCLDVQTQVECTAKSSKQIGNDGNAVKMLLSSKNDGRGGGVKRVSTNTSNMIDQFLVQNRISLLLVIIVCSSELRFYSHNQHNFYVNGDEYAPTTNHLYGQQRYILETHISCKIIYSSIRTTKIIFLLLAFLISVYFASANNILYFQEFV